MKELKVFSASWCGPCQALKPTIEALQEEGKAITIIDIEKNADETATFGVRGVPTIIAIKDGVECGRIVGSTSREKLLELLEE